MYIRSDTVILDSFTCGDLDALFEIAHDSDIRHYVPYAYCESISNAEELLQCYMNYDDIHDYGVAIRTTDKELIGALLVNQASFGSYEVCYFIKKEQRRKGYCVSALKLFIEYLLKSEQYCDLFFEVRRSNIASQKVLRSLGIKMEDEYQEYFVFHV